MNKQSGSAHVVIIVIAVIAIIGVLGFLLWQNVIRDDDVQQNQTDTTQADSTTQRYTNETLGYSVEVPADWILEEPENPEDTPIIRNLDPTASLENGAGFPEGYIDITIFKEVDDANFSAMAGLTTTGFYEALGTRDLQKGAGSYDAASVQAITVNGIPAKSTKSSFTQVNEVLYILNDGALFQINLFPYGSSDNASVKTILDSFTIL